MSTSRREFLTGCGATAVAIAGSKLASLSFAEAAEPVALAPHFGILVVVFLRGGMDGLNLVAPVDDPQYIAARPASLRIVGEGDNPGVPLQNAPAGFDFRLHPSAKPLKDLYDAGSLAIIHAAGLTSGTRSHGEAADLMERGVLDPQDQTLHTGWLARHLALFDTPAILPAASLAETPAACLIGANSAVTLRDLSQFAFNGDENLLNALQSLHDGAGLIQDAGARTIATLKAFNAKLPRNDKGEVEPYQPAENVSYPGQSDFSNSLQTLAHLIKLDVGLQAAAIELGGWDTHQNQEHTFGGLVEQLSNSLAAFYADVSGYHDRVNILVMSEFGRRLKANESGGTDHGHGNVMLALGGSVRGGKIYGKWPGLAHEQLDSGADLAITTDYRTILSEVLVRRFGDTRLSTVFPGLKHYAPLGLFKGMDVKTDIG